METEIDVQTFQNTQSGKWLAKCPLCDWSTVGYLSKYCADLVVEHMNEEHKEGRAGHA